MIKTVTSIFKAIVAIFILSIICFILIFLAYLFPTERMFSHVKESKDIFSTSFSAWTVGIDSAIVSYPTDAIMLDCAIYSKQENGAIYNALMNPRYENGKGNPQESLYEVLQYNDASEIKANRKTITKADSFMDEYNKNGEIETMYYPRYWHGYLIFLKPLLLVLNVSEIKMLSLLIQTILISITSYLIREKLGIGVATAFLSMIVILNPVTILLTLAETIVFIIVLVTCDSLLIFNNTFIEDDDKLHIFFLVVGATTSFLDFLTYPLATLGIPLALFLMLNSSKVKAIRCVICNSISWAFGYAGLWMCKFIICTLMTDYNALYGGLKSIAFRLGNGEMNEGYDTSVSVAIRKNLGVLQNWQTVAICILFIIVIVYLLIKGFHYRMPKNILLGLMTIACFPFLWFAVLSNHSTIHYYFTYREIAISWFIIWAVLLFRWEKENED